MRQQVLDPAYQRHVYGNGRVVFAAQMIDDHDQIGFERLEDLQGTGAGNQVVVVVFHEHAKDVTA